MVAVGVEAHAGGRLLLGVQRHQQLELEGRLDLRDRLHLADAAEERVARLVDPAGQRELFAARPPAFASIQRSRKAEISCGAPIATNSRMRKALQTVEIRRRFAAEAIGRRHRSAGRPRAACRARRRSGRSGSRPAGDSTISVAPRRLGPPAVVAASAAARMSASEPCSAQAAADQVGEALEVARAARDRGGSSRAGSGTPPSHPRDAR